MVVPPNLGRPLESPRALDILPESIVPDYFVVTAVDAPLGFTGPSSVAPTETQENGHFVPVPDRWRIGFPDWDRYDKGHPAQDDYPYQVGHWWDPYNLNVLKGDYPVIGQHTFMNLTATSLTNIDYREVPTATSPFESTANPGQRDFFGHPGQLLANEFLILDFDLFHGDAAFKPADWRIHLTPIFNVSSLNVNELSIVNPDVGKGTSRGRTFLSLEEWFVETKLADLGPDYDFISVRAGSQPFVSDFRGFLFSDINRAIRLFGDLDSNREQFNVAYFIQQEKDTNSTLNDTFSNRHQQILLANYYLQDFLFPGYTAQFSVNFDNDEPSIKFNRNGVLVRPDPDGVFQPHHVEAAYLGWAGDGHINHFNVTHQVYWAVGHDSLNPLANQAQDINAWFAAGELSYDRDYTRFRVSGLYSSGDGNISNHHATGFDSIFDNPNFAGGQFSYWQREAIALNNVNLVQANSLIPDLRSSKIQGQANFVNPGLNLINFGVDLDLTPKLKWINNLNFLWFDKTNVLETFLFQSNIRRFIGEDASTGFEYRPFLNENVVALLGVSALIPGQGFDDIFAQFGHAHAETLFATFMKLKLTY